VTHLEGGRMRFQIAGVDRSDLRDAISAIVSSYPTTIYKAASAAIQSEFNASRVRPAGYKVIENA
jgi:hypothetical protein